MKNPKDPEDLSKKEYNKLIQRKKTEKDREEIKIKIELLEQNDYKILCHQPKSNDYIMHIIHKGVIMSDANDLKKEIEKKYKSNECDEETKQLMGDKFSPKRLNDIVQIKMNSLLNDLLKYEGYTVIEKQDEKRDGMQKITVIEILDKEGKSVYKRKRNKYSQQD